MCQGFYQGHHQVIITHRYLKFNLLKLDMKKIFDFWLKDDFRLKKNLALIEATKNHEKVVVFYLYKN